MNQCVRHFSVFEPAPRSANDCTQMYGSYAIITLTGLGLHPRSRACFREKLNRTEVFIGPMVPRVPTPHGTVEAYHYYVIM